MIEQHGAVFAHHNGFVHVARQFLGIVHDVHGAAAEHVARANDDRIADAFGGFKSRFLCVAGGVGRLAQPQLIDELLEAFAVFSAVDGVRTGADDLDAFCFERAADLERRLTAVLHDHAFRFLDATDFQNIFERHRFEIQTIGSVIVGRNGLGVAIDHDRFVAVFAQRHGCVHAAVVKFDALTDTVRTTAKNHDLSAVGRHGFAFVLIGRIHVSRAGFEFGRARIDALVDRMYVEFMATMANVGFLDAEHICQALVREAFLLQEEHFFLG